MIPDSLNTNQIKDASGTETEFSLLSRGDRSAVWAATTEGPSQPYRLSVKHQESGSGPQRRRRSVVRFDLVTESDVDEQTPITTSAYLVIDIPTGLSNDYDTAKKALANLLSLCASTGASTTILYDCSGYGASALINGTL